MVVHLSTTYVRSSDEDCGDLSFVYSHCCIKCIELVSLRYCRPGGIECYYCILDLQANA